MIDFWGIGDDIAEKMGVIGDIRHRGYQVREVRFVDDRGCKQGGFDVDVFKRLTNDRFTSVRRSDISATIYRAIEGKVETLLGESVAGIEEQSDGVHVTFDHAPPRDADLVTLFLGIFRNEYLSDAAPRSIIRKAFAGAGGNGQRLMPLLKKKQKCAAQFASSFAPATNAGIVFRNVVTRLMRWPSIADFFIGRALRDEIEVPDYGWPVSSSSREGQPN